jgi:hypothetical protein
VDQGFWLGLFLAIPISILANMLTPKVSTFLGAGIRSRALRRTRKMRKDYRVIKSFVEDRQLFIESLLEALLYIIVLGVGCVIVAVVVFAEPANLPEESAPDLFSRFLADPIAYVTNIFLAVCVVVFALTCENAMSVIYKVRNFREYEERVFKAFGDVPD